MTREIKITPPEGYEIDKEHSTLECIKFKPIEKRWRDSNPKVNGYYICHYTNLTNGVRGYLWNDGNRYIFATKKQAKSALAMAQISQIMANDERFGGVVTDEEWANHSITKWTIERCGNKIITTFRLGTYIFLAFHTREQRNLFLEENKDLIKDYLMID